VDWCYFRQKKSKLIWMPPLAKHWSNPNRSIEPSEDGARWVFLGAAIPQPGYVAIGAGHMGIPNYDGSWINAGHDNVARVRRLVSVEQKSALTPALEVV
jgi:hypothetical protein